MPSIKPLIENQQRVAAQRGKRWKPKKLARQQYPHALEIAYKKKLVAMVDYLNRLIEERLFSKLPDIIAQAKSVRSDAYTDTVTSIVNTIQNEFGEQYSEDQIRYMASAQANQVSNFQRNQLTRMLSNSLGVDIFLSEPYLKTEIDSFIKTNVDLITSIPTQQLRDVDQVVLSAIRSGQPAKDTEALIKAKWGESLRDKPRNRAELIARDQSGKLFGEINHLRQTELGIDEYIWRGVLDDRERESHRENEGKTFSWKKPPSQTGHPGSDYQCRCIAEPNLQKLVDETAVEPEPAPVIPSPPVPAPTQPPAPMPEPVAPAPAPIPTPAPLPLPTGVSPAPKPRPLPRAKKPAAAIPGQPVKPGELTPEAQKLFAAFDFPQKGELAGKVKEAMNAIARVFKRNKLTFEKIPVKFSTATRVLGRLQIRRQFDQASGKFVERFEGILINRKGDHPALTFAHEFGHYLDYLMGKRQTQKFISLVQSSRSYSEELQAVMNWKNAIGSSKEVKALKDIGHRGNTELGISYRFSNYLLRQEELFARSFAQLIAEEGGSDLMKKELAETFTNQSYKGFQWSEESFREVKPALKQLLDSEG